MEKQSYTHKAWIKEDKVMRGILGFSGDQAIVDMGAVDDKSDKNWFKMFGPEDIVQLESTFQEDMEGNDLFSKDVVLLIWGENNDTAILTIEGDNLYDLTQEFDNNDTEYRVFLLGNLVDGSFDKLVGGKINEIRAGII